MTKIKKKWRIFTGCFTVLVLFGLLCMDVLFIVNRYVIHDSMEYILSETEAAGLDDVDCILVLGAGVYNNKYPSLMLQDRLGQRDRAVYARCFRPGFNERRQQQSQL